MSTKKRFYAKLSDDVWGYKHNSPPSWEVWERVPGTHNTQRLCEICCGGRATARKIADALNRTS